MATPVAPETPEHTKKDAGEKEDKEAAVLAGAFGTVAAILALLGGTSGGIERMLRNHTVWSVIWFCLIALGICIALVVQVAKPGGWKRAVALGVASFIFAAGTVGATALAAMTPSTRDRPSVSATLLTEGELILEARVHASGLRSNEHLTIVVNGLAGSGEVHRLYHARVGPSSTGIIDQTLRMPLPSGRFNRVSILAIGADDELDSCRAYNVRNGCVILQIPRASRPHIVADWSEVADGQPALSLDISGDGIGADATVRVLVFGMANGKPQLISDSHLAADAGGKTRERMVIPFPPNAEESCVVAFAELVRGEGSNVRPDDWREFSGCPGPLFPNAVWLETPVPSGRLAPRLTQANTT